MFCNDPGYSNTNSNIESFNATFKREYTIYYKCTMLAACRKIFNCIRDYSDSSQKRNVFNKMPRFDKEIKEKANKIEDAIKVLSLDEVADMSTRKISCC